MAESAYVERRPAVAVIKEPFLRFAQLESSQGILLLACTAIALAWSNSPWSHSYAALWHTEISIDLGVLKLSKSLLHWVNDGLMTVFFFVVGLEIKREALVGELASIRKATLPILAAIGGMAVPASLYAAFNWGRPGSSGWGIPMATDIAFALGVMALLGKAVPVSLKVFLTALAIVDDIGAVLVIAVFYTSELHWLSLAIAGGCLGVLAVVSWAGVRHALVYLILGIGLWLGVLESGIHATLAGVMLAMTIPARSRMDPEEFLAESRSILDHFDRADDKGLSLLSSEQQQSAVHALEQASERVQTPLARMESTLHPWVSFFIMPLFALANAGVPLGVDLIAKLAEPVGLGVLAGLVLGKPIGILMFSGAAVGLGWTDRPREASWRQIAGVGCLAGIGFTMSLFIAHLALAQDLLRVAKAAILLASVLSGVAGWVLLRHPKPGAGGSDLQ